MIISKCTAICNIKKCFQIPDNKSQNENVVVKEKKFPKVVSKFVG
tara:strand:+ start:208 stop:342 length:135 start_codon:yes stop_codon:yes gene_type:complete